MQTEYRITVGDTIRMTREYPSNWSDIARLAVQRGYPARLERHSAFGLDMLELLEDCAGWVVVKCAGIVVSPWETLAEIDGRLDG